MKRFGLLLVLLGAGIAIVGTLPFLELVLQDPKAAPDHSGMLMTFSWYAGGALLGIGVLMAVFGRHWHRSGAI